jgi:hypothetical protein
LTEEDGSDLSHPDIHKEDAAMKSKGISRADANKALRQEALREQLASKGLLQKVIEDAAFVRDLSIELDPLQVQRIKVAIDTRLALVKKYMPDLKSIEVQGDVEHGGQLVITWAAPAPLPPSASSES